MPHVAGGRQEPGESRRARVLVVDDEAAIRESLVYALERDSFVATQAASLDEARAAVDDVDLLILDLMLPDGSGLDLLGQLRAARSLPVIVLTSRSGEADRVVGLELGADDYVLKPFSPRELVARVRAVLRRTGVSATARTSDAARRCGPITLDSTRRTVRWHDSPLELSKIEFDLLQVFVGAPGRVFERAQLIHHAWAQDVNVAERTVDAHVKSLRQKIRTAGGDPGLLETVRGVGYRLRESA